MFRRLNIDRVISFLPRANILAVVLGYLLDVPTIINERNNSKLNYASTFKRRLFYKTLKQVYRKASIIVANSTELLEQLNDEIACVRKGFVIHNIFDYKSVSKLSSETLQPSIIDWLQNGGFKSYVVSVSRINEQKRIDRLLRIKDEISRRDDSIGLVVLGENELGDDHWIVKRLLFDHGIYWGGKFLIHILSSRAQNV